MASPVCGMRGAAVLREALAARSYLEGIEDLNAPVEKRGMLPIVRWDHGITTVVYPHYFRRFNDLTRAC
jgi:hypothetical protein